MDILIIAFIVLVCFFIHRDRSPSILKDSESDISKWLEKGGYDPKDIKISGRGGVSLTDSGLKKARQALRNKSKN